MVIAPFGIRLSKTCFGRSEAVTRVVLKNSTKFTGKHLCQSFLFNNVAAMRPATLLKKRLWHWYFPVNFAKFLRTLFLQNTSGRLLPHSIKHLWYKSFFPKIVTNFKINRRSLTGSYIHLIVGVLQITLYCFKDIYKGFSDTFRAFWKCIEKNFKNYHFTQLHWDLGLKK